MDYRLISATRTVKDNINHVVQIGGEETTFKYISVRMALIFPSEKHPAFFVVGGMEPDDPLAAPRELKTVRLLYEEEVQDLNPDGLFSRVTDYYSMCLADSCFVDFRNKDFYTQFWDFLDRRNLRTVDLLDVPYRDNFTLRLGLVRKFNDAGALVIPRESALFSDLHGVSRASLQGEDAEERSYRLNCLSYLIASFDKFVPLREFMGQKLGYEGKEGGWML
jgi:hypothetical protein